MLRLFGPVEVMSGSLTYVLVPSALGSLTRGLVRPPIGARGLAETLHVVGRTCPIAGARGPLKFFFHQLLRPLAPS